MRPSEAWHEIVCGPFWVDCIEIGEPVSETNARKKSGTAAPTGDTVEPRRQLPTERATRLRLGSNEAVQKDPRENPHPAR